MNTDINIKQAIKDGWTIGRILQHEREVKSLRIKKSGDRENRSRGDAKLVSKPQTFQTSVFFPRTLNYTKLRKAREQLEWKKIQAQLNIKEV